MQQKQNSFTPIIQIELSIDYQLDQCKRLNSKIKKTEKWPFALFLFLLFLVIVFFYDFKMNHLYFLNYGYQLQGIEDELSSQIKQVLKSNPYYDVHYFVNDQHTQMSEIIVKEPGFRIQSKVIKQKRQIIEIKHSEKSLNKIIKQMNNPYLRAKSFFKYKDQTRLPKITENLQKMYFAYSLDKKPNNKQYLEAEYYRLDKQYQIGKYGDQLPFCVLLTGRNDVKSIQRLYNSIKTQNYSNFHVVHVDDCSKDGTIERVMHYLERNPEFDHKVTLISQPYIKNALYNRDFGISKHCLQNDIILDIDADDWLIGRQVFQLVNTVYQTGNTYKGNNQDIWALYLNNLAVTYNHKIPISFFEGELPEQQLQKGLYRVTVNWRTTQLRTYLRKLYMKVDKNDYIDKIAVKPHSYFGLQSDSFMNNGMVELSGYKHLKFLDQYVYYYNRNDNAKRAIQFTYSAISSQILPPYEELKSLEDVAKRKYNLRAPDHYYQIYQKSRSQVAKKRNSIIQMIKNKKR